MVECTSTKDALSVAYSMLKVIEMGGSFSTAAWYERLQAIEPFLPKGAAQKAVAAAETDKHIGRQR